MNIYKLAHEFYNNNGEIFGITIEDFPEYAVAKLLFLRASDPIYLYALLSSCKPNSECESGPMYWLKWYYGISEIQEEINIDNMLGDTEAAKIVKTQYFQIKNCLNIRDDMPCSYIVKKIIENKTPWINMSSIPSFICFMKRVFGVELEDYKTTSLYVDNNRFFVVGNVIYADGKKVVDIFNNSSDTDGIERTLNKLEYLDLTFDELQLLKESDLYPLDLAPIYEIIRYRGCDNKTKCVRCPFFYDCGKAYKKSCQN